ncbi:MAG: PEGA domain-containing protein [Chitinispirillaceae bacterium]|nr:PEGA domain-containing protein [Chitinispirillaceae bacterium]
MFVSHYMPLYRYPCLMIGLLAAMPPASGQMQSEPAMLLGCIRNETTHREFDGIHGALGSLLTDLPEFPRTILDTTVRVDSFPDETSLLKARAMNAAYILWGVVDSGESGPGIAIVILDMKQGSVSHLRISINRNESDKEVAEMVRSKLQLWLQRTTMVQLIVTTNPSAASVLLDGRPLGSTPFEGMVQPGTYRLELRKKPFIPMHMPISLISGNTYQYDFALNSDEKKTDRISVVKWLGVSIACLGTGGGAHWQYSHARERYREAVPPADFDRLYNRAIACEIGRDVLFAAAGTALTVMILKVVF